MKNAGFQGETTMHGRTKTQVHYQPWSQQEVATLMEAWPRGGMKPALAALPHRNNHQIKGKAYALNLTIPSRPVYQRFPASEFIDAALRRAYREGRPDLKALAKTTGRTTGWLKYRAQVLGISIVHRGRPCGLWGENEDQILRDAIEEGRSITTMRSRLRTAGHCRSLTAINSRLYALELYYSREWWTAADVSRIFDVDLHVITRWIQSKALRAEKVPGIHALHESASMWKILPSAVRDFMLACPEKWDHRKMRKEMLLDLLCPKTFNAAVAKKAK